MLVHVYCSCGFDEVIDGEPIVAWGLVNALGRLHFPHLFNAQVLNEPEHGWASVEGDPYGADLTPWTNCIYQFGPASIRRGGVEQTQLGRFYLCVGEGAPASEPANGAKRPDYAALL